MKKANLLLIFIFLWCVVSIFMFKCSAQQNGTFKNVYVDSIKHIKGRAGVAIQNDTFPFEATVNDTALIPYIIYWGSKGSSVDTSKLVTKYDLATGL